jgi:hypothetical protein
MKNRQEFIEIDIKFDSCDTKANLLISKGVRGMKCAIHAITKIVLSSRVA